MATVTAADVKKLRQLTDAPMMACKKALDDAEGDFDKAADLVRERTGAKMDARATERTAAEGAIFAASNDAAGVLVQIACETDFVAKGDNFQELGKAIAQIALDAAPADVAAILASPMDGLTVAEVLSQTQAKMGEKLEIAAFTRYEGTVQTYLHIPSPGAPAKIGVIVAFDGDVTPELAKGICQHIAFSKPLVLTADAVDVAMLEKEKSFARKELLEEGKPESMIEKILVGKVNKLYSEWVLNDQPYILDDKQKVGKVVAAAGASITGFKRLQVG